jgi:hypothetical protein
MRVKETNLGGGVIRLEVVPTFCGEFIPTHVVDQIMRDVMTRKSIECKPKVETHRCNCGHVGLPNMPWANKNLTPRQREELAWRDTSREPDGIDVHVDRPRKEKFCSQRSWADAMAKYRMLEDAARACDWECREPMKGTIEQPKNTWTCGEQPKNTWNCCEKHVCVDDLVEELLSIVEDLETDCYDSASVADYLRWV